MLTRLRGGAFQISFYIMQWNLLESFSSIKRFISFE
jgi:hypothetical protein